MADVSHPSAFSRALNKVLFEGRFTLAELAEEADVSPRHLRDVKNQQAYLNHEAADRIRRLLCRNGEMRPSETALCAGTTARRKVSGESNGSVDDDFAQIMQSLGHLKDHEEDLDQEQGRKAIREIRKEVADLEREVEGWE